MVPNVARKTSKSSLIINLICCHSFFNSCKIAHRMPGQQNVNNSYKQYKR